MQHIGLLLMFICVATNIFSQNEPVNASEDEALASLVFKLNKADSYLNTKPDSSFAIYQELRNVFKDLSDTVNLSKCHIGLSDVYKNKGQYGKAYDHLWDALFLAKSIGDKELLIKVHNDLSALYGIFEKYNNSIEHLHKSLNLTKFLVENYQLDKDRLIPSYYGLAVQNRKNHNYRTALNYLDSCQLISKMHSQYPKRSLAYVDAERGYISFLINDMQQAEYHLFRAKKYFTSKDSNYQVIINTFVGHFLLKKGDYKAAIASYQQALKAIDRLKAHVDLRTEILKSLVTIYEKQNRLDMAYANLKEANELTDSLFNVKSLYNNRLFQIKNKYRETIKSQNFQIVKQNAIIERELLFQSRLKVFIGFIFFIALVIGVIVRLRYKLRKYQLEKTQIELQAKLDKENTETLIQFKSRELTANTLQFIEKDKIIDELLGILKKEAPSSYKKAKLQISKGNTDMWQQFNKRFIEVNSDFYKNLRHKHPELTPTEQKHCALIRLKLDTKEMTHLLNISLNSVQISRHRIRKKIGLKRNENLSNYIADI